MTLFSLIHKDFVQKTSSNKIIPAEEFSQLLDIYTLLEKAKSDAELLHQETEAECVLLKEKAHNEGFQEGLTRWNSQLIYLDQKVKEMQHEMQKLILPLALKAAKKIVGNQLELNPATIVEIIQQVLKPVKQSYEVKILVSKEDKEVVEQHKETLKALFDHLRLLVIEEKEDLTKGSCIIETETGIINASLENQWRALETAFENFLKR